MTGWPVRRALSLPLLLSQGYLRAAGCFGAAFIGLALLVATGWLRPLDLALVEAARFGTPCWALNASEAASLVLAGELSLGYVGVLAMLCLWARHPLPGLFLIGLLLATVMIEFIFKFSLPQPAPHALLINVDRPDCIRPTYLEYPLAGVAVPNTFPSGYAVRAAYFGLLVAAMVGARWPSLAGPARLALLPLLLILAASRLAIAWHWASDVLGGLLLGAAAACLALAVANGFRWMQPDRTMTARRYGGA
jgi:membrane-associated phospholipid phosphatase